MYIQTPDFEPKYIEIWAQSAQFEIKFQFKYQTFFCGLKIFLVTNVSQKP